VQFDSAFLLPDPPVDRHRRIRAWVPLPAAPAAAGTDPEATYFHAG
jgi:hypothetical protein